MKHVRFDAASLCPDGVCRSCNLVFWAASQGLLEAVKRDKLQVVSTPCALKGCEHAEDDQCEGQGAVHAPGP